MLMEPYRYLAWGLAMHIISSELRKIAPLLVAVVLLLGVAGCGDEVKLPPMSAEEVVKKAATAIQAPKSFHFNLKTDNMHTFGGGPWLTDADGDAVKPDKMRGKVTVRYSGAIVSSDVIVDGESQYWTIPPIGVWTRMPSYFNVSQLFNPAKGAASILESVKGLSSDDTEKIGGVPSYRVKGTVSPEALRALTQEVTVKSDIPVTLWVAASNFLLTQVRLHGPLIEGEPGEIARTVTLSDFDKEVKIETPVVK
jgi:hypothetical protein